jgi:hypothetical protein
MRKRGRSPTENLHSTNAVHDGSDHDDILDTADQDELIETLDAESRSQSKRFQTAFAVVAIFAMAISLFVYPFLCHDECSTRPILCWSHAILSCGSHALSIKLSLAMNVLVDPHGHLKPSDPMFPPRAVLESPMFVLGAVAHVVPVLLWVLGTFHQDMEHFHIGLTLGNLVTLLGALTILWDTYTTRQALDDLYGAKYEHKSL